MCLKASMGLSPLDQIIFANKHPFHSIGRSNGARTKSKECTLVDVKGEWKMRKVIKKNQRRKQSLITEHSRVTTHQTNSNCSLSTFLLVLWELQSENKEHIWVNCWSHIKISMLLYPKHMAQLREKFPTASPKHSHPHCYPSLRPTHQENYTKQNASNYFELLRWNRIIESKHVIS